MDQLHKVFYVISGCFYILLLLVAFSCQCRCFNLHVPSLVMCFFSASSSQKVIRVIDPHPGTHLPLPQLARLLFATVYGDSTNLNSPGHFVSSRSAPQLITEGYCICNVANSLPATALKQNYRSMLLKRF